MSNNATTKPALDPEASRILDFWFTDLPPTNPSSKWFSNPDGAAFDAQIRDQFSSLVTLARDTDQLDHWTSTPEGTIALLLLLDQFPRNIYRHDSNPTTSHLSFACADKAERIVLETLSRMQSDNPALPTCHKLPACYQFFLYIPLMHAESLPLQLLCRTMYENLRLRVLAPGSDVDLGGIDREVVLKMLNQGLPFAQEHVEVVRRFGRFPRRNDALSRVHTEEEREYLDGKPDGF